MRKLQQKQLIELIETLREAQSAGLYADAQDGALAAGEFIENIEGEGTETVTLLAEYCELLFKASIGEIGDKLLRKQLIKVENSIRRELKPNQMEIVFFPYQLSMFDVFETIYLTAKEDPNCDVYCVPIPWFERNHDGSFGTMHYDGADYPEYIEITDWREYDVERRNPDVIFVHNPFDDSNYISSIHPDFYSSRLKKCTDLLCYMAYFLPTYVDGSVAKSTAKFTVAYPADLIIAQSEAEKQKYLSVNPKTNVVALGSPKLDRIINAAKEHEIPEKWIKKIPGIHSKKVIMLNSSLAYLLKYNEEYLNRIAEYITAINSRPEFVLVWRPHPLILPTLKTMRPAMLSQYRQLIEMVNNSALAILDDSPSFLDAMLSSCCYVGESNSSIARMYTITGKPMFTTVMARVSLRDELAGGTLVFDYPETVDFSINVFMEKQLNGEIPDFNQNQVDFQENIFPNCNGTAGEKIYQYIKKSWEVNNR